jgi:hypothetical protein
MSFNGATVQGSSGLYFVSGSGPVSVSGASGNTTMLGGSDTSVLEGGPGSNLIARVQRRASRSPRRSCRWIVLAPVPPIIVTAPEPSANYTVVPLPPIRLDAPIPHHRWRGTRCLRLRQ